MTESFPRQEARTRRFSLGVPRAFRVSPDGARVVYLRTQGGADPVTCLWVLDVATGQERLAADPRALGPDGGGEEDLPPEERARRERVREQAGGIVAYATDDAVTLAVFALSGRVYTASLRTDGPDGTAAVRAVATRTPALDPRPDPAGRRLAYVCGGALRVARLAEAGPDDAGPADAGPADDRAVADPAGAPGVTFGLAEFIAAEEMNRVRGYWWAPDGSALLVARVDDTPVNRWHIADPAHPERAAAEVAYPAAGTANADVTLHLARLGTGPGTGTGTGPDTGRAGLVPVQTGGPPSRTWSPWNGRPGTIRWWWCRAGISARCGSCGWTPAGARPRSCTRTPTRSGWRSSPACPAGPRTAASCGPRTSRTPAAWCC